MTPEMVDRGVIDMLVKLALEGPLDGSSQRPWRPLDEGEGGGPLDPDALAVLLTGANVGSVCDALGSYDYDILPGARPVYWMASFHWIDPGVTATTVEGLVALELYARNARHHRKWAGHDAQKFCEALRGRLVRCLPGCAEAIAKWHGAG